MENEKTQRIAKIIARSGLCSRREAERYILAGRVKLNHKIVDTPATLCSANDVISVDNKPIKQSQETLLWLYNKPAGCLTTHRDPQGRTTIFDKIGQDLPAKHIVTVGRLDMNSEGLLLLTNNGELARELELPSTAWKRVYRVRVFGKLDPLKLKRLQKGITYQNVKYGPVEVEIEKQAAHNSWIKMTLTEGKNREVRKLCEAIDLTVNRLIRVSYGPFHLGKLAKNRLILASNKILKDNLGRKINAHRNRKPAQKASSRS